MGRFAFGRHAALALVSAAVLAASNEVALARCNVPSFNFTFGEAGAASMNADSGAPCNIKLRQGLGSEFRSVSIVSAPAHGAVRVQDNLNFAYRSRPGYRGTDTFVVVVRGSKFGDARVTRLTVAVAVAPSPAGAVTNTAWPGGTRAARPAGQPRQAAAPSGLRAKCLQDAGAGRDPVTGQMQFYLNHPSRMDRYKLCMAGGDRAKANAIAVPELTRVHPGDRGPTFRQ